MKKIFLIVLVAGGISFAQNPFATRYGDSFLRKPGINFYSVSRYLPVVAISGLNGRSSNSNLFTIDNIPFNIIPFDFLSPDLIPLDFLNSRFETSRSTLSPFSNHAFGKMNFLRTPIADSTNVSLRGFLGSVTGDPLIFTFTRHEEEVFNRNKIVPSGVISFSSAKKNLAFRLSAGYFGYFITGSLNDKLIRTLDSYYFKKQNKQVLLSAEGNYKLNDGRSVSLFSSFISYYGWDAAPFLFSFNHLEMYLKYYAGYFRKFY